MPKNTDKLSPAQKKAQILRTVSQIKERKRAPQADETPKKAKKVRTIKESKIPYQSPPVNRYETGAVLLKIVDIPITPDKPAKFAYVVESAQLMHQYTIDDDGKTCKPTLKYTRNNTEFFSRCYIAARVLARSADKSFTIQWPEEDAIMDARASWELHKQQQNEKTPRRVRAQQKE